jgi:phosphate transport system permease protein
MLASEGLPHTKDMAFATGAILIIVVFLVNYATTKLASKLGRLK